MFVPTESGRMEIGMDYRKEFEEMMKSQTAIAVATSLDGMPNVRIVNFYYDTNEKTLYFSSFSDNAKIAELEQNPQIAFTTIAINGEEHVRVRSGRAYKSNVKIEEIKEKFLEKMPNYIMSLADVLQYLILFEVRFDNAEVVVDLEHIETISI